MIDPDGMAPDSAAPNKLSDPVANPTIRPTSKDRNKSRFVNNPNFVPRIDVNTGEVRLHNGLDIQAAEGTPLKSITSGTVYNTSVSKQFGNLIIIKGKDENGKTVYVLYAHLSKVDVKSGQKVEAGQQIDATGTTGNARGLIGVNQHVHIEVSTNGEFRPLKFGVGTRIDPESIIPTKFDNNGNPIVSPPPASTGNNNNSGSRPTHNETPMKPLFTWPKSAPWLIQSVH